MGTINSWGNAIADAKSAITLNAGTNTISIGSDASNNTINLASGAGAKVVQLGSTNGASSLDLKYGTADFTVASATGTSIRAENTGEVTFPLQSSFLAALSAPATNVTGNGGAYHAICNSEKYDVNSDYSTVTGDFTAPVSGKYYFSGTTYVNGCVAANQGVMQFITTINQLSIWNFRASSSSAYGLTFSVSTNMDAGDTCYLKITLYGESSNIDDVYGDGSTAFTSFSGQLLS